MQKGEEACELTKGITGSQVFCGELYFGKNSELPKGGLPITGKITQ